MGIERETVVGHWSNDAVKERIATWMRTAVGIAESSHLRVMRVAEGEKILSVALTEHNEEEVTEKPEEATADAMEGAETPEEAAANEIEEVIPDDAEEISEE
jgi:L-arabinose isomerase